MSRARLYRMALLMLGGALVGVYCLATAQDGRAPWPPPPIVPPEPEEQEVAPNQPQNFPIAPTRLTPAAPAADPEFLPPLAPTPNKVTAMSARAEEPPPPDPVPMVPDPVRPAVKPIATPVALPGARPPAAPPAKTPLPKTPQPKTPPRLPEKKGPAPLPLIKTTEPPLPAAPPPLNESSAPPLPTFPVQEDTPKLPAKPPVMPPANPLPLPLPDLLITPPNVPSSPPTVPAAPPIVPWVPPKENAAPPTGPSTIAPKPEVPSKPPAFRLVNPLYRKNAMDSAGPPGDFVVNPGPIASTPSTGGPGGSRVSVDKRGPTQVHGLEPIPFVITVRNQGAAPLLQLRLEDEIPAGATFTQGQPEPLLNGNKAVWTIAALAAGEEKQFRITLQPMRAGELVGATHVFLPVRTMTRTKVDGLPQGPEPKNEDGPALPLKLSLNGPATVAIGAQAVFELEIVNQGQSPLAGVKLLALLDEGLSHPEGQSLEAELNVLTPGAVKTFKMPVTAVKAGRHTLQIRMANLSGQQAGASAAVQVGEAALKVSQPPITKLLLDRDGEVKIELTNFQPQALKNVVVINRLPEGIEFAGASDRGLYRQDSNSVHWLVDHLPAGQNKTLILKVNAKKQGQFINEVTAKADQAGENRSRASLDVEAHASLSVKVSDRDDPVEVGRETMYEVVLHNHGGSAASNIHVAVELPENMKPGRVQGAAYRAEGRLLIFQPITRIAPGGQVVLSIAATGQQPGQQRVRVQVTSDQIRQPLVREERTTVYRD